MALALIVGVIASIDFYAGSFAVLFHPVSIIVATIVARKWRLAARVVYLTSSLAIASVLVVGLVKPSETAWGLRDLGFVACLLVTAICLWWIRRD